MKCLKCGVENQNSEKYCSECKTPMTWTPDSEYVPPVEVKVSRLAITAISLALISAITYLAILFNAYRINISTPAIGIILGVLGIGTFCILGISVILGIVSLIRIEISGGRITGLSFSIGAILIPLFAVIAPIFFVIPARTRSTAFRMVCGTNLSGLGNAMLFYAHDYNNELPRAGGKGGTWGTSVKFDAGLPTEAYGMKNGTGGSATISSSLYLLVKYAEVTPKSFICKGDSGGIGVSEFTTSGNMDYITFWDFGPEPWRHNSYAYNMPYSSNALNFSMNPGMAIMADRNPWISSSKWKVKDFSAFALGNGQSFTKNGNTPCHQDQGQNVLFLDTHVTFENVSLCGINKDNIYTSWNGNDIHRGIPPKVGSQPAGKTDSLLVNDPRPTGP